MKTPLLAGLAALLLTASAQAAQPVVVPPNPVILPTDSPPAVALPPDTGAKAAATDGKKAKQLARVANKTKDARKAKQAKQAKAKPHKASKKIAKARTGSKPGARKAAKAG